MTKRLHPVMLQQGEEDPQGPNMAHISSPFARVHRVGYNLTGRSRSLCGHRAARTTRHVRMVEQVETHQKVTAEDIEYLEGRALALRERINQEETAVARYRDDMALAADLTSTQRRELQSRI